MDVPARGRKDGEEKEGRHDDLQPYERVGGHGEGVSIGGQAMVGQGVFGDASQQTEEGETRRDGPQNLRRDVAGDLCAFQSAGKGHGYGHRGIEMAS